MQNRMLAQGPLHRADGLLSETGYALAPIKEYDRKRIKAPRHRIKEWDCYLVMNPHCAIALTVADGGCMGLDSLSFIDFETLSQRNVSRMSWMPLGRRNLPASSQQGVARAVGKDYEFTFRAEGSQRQLYGHMYDFGGPNRPLLFDIVLEDPRQDSMVIVTPFENKPGRFFYNRKVNCLPAEGRVTHLACRGFDNAAIAAKLGKQEQTVANQLHGVYEKLREWLGFPSYNVDRSVLIAKFAPYFALREMENNVEK